MKCFGVVIRACFSFFPGQMGQLSHPLLPSINSLETNDTVYRFTSNKSLQFPYYTSSFTFHFSSGELAGGKNNLYSYRLTGLDKEWKTPTATGQVAYSKLPPGQYKFEVRASRDGIHWFDAPYPLSIRVKKPWWQQNWFRVAYITSIYPYDYLDVSIQATSKKICRNTKDGRLLCQFRI